MKAGAEGCWAQHAAGPIPPGSSFSQECGVPAVCPEGCPMLAWAFGNARWEDWGSGKRVVGRGTTRWESLFLPDHVSLRPYPVAGKLPHWPPWIPSDWIPRFHPWRFRGSGWRGHGLESEGSQRLVVRPPFHLHPGTPKFHLVMKLPQQAALVSLTRHRGLERLWVCQDRETQRPCPPFPGLGQGVRLCPSLYPLDQMKNACLRVALNSPTSCPPGRLGRSVF